MREGDIAKAALQQSNNSFKIRPVLLLKKMPPFGDWLVCGISTQLKHEVNNFDIILSDSETGFENTGLLRSSLIRLGFLSVVPENIIEGSIGIISEEIYHKLISNLTEHLNNFSA